MGLKSPFCVRREIMNIKDEFNQINLELTENKNDICNKINEKISQTQNQIENKLKKENIVVKVKLNIIPKINKYHILQ